MTALLEIKDLEVQFRTLDGIVHAVNGICCHLDEGETLGIVGESGCGKSVSVLSVLRLIPEPPGKVVSGEVIFKGQDLMRLSERQMEDVRGKEIAMVFQDPMTSLNPVLSIGRQITETLMVHMGMDRPDADQRAIELLEMVGLPQPSQCLGAYPHEFSGGMRQRVMIAMALCCNPEVLIADEPTTALDVTIQAQILDLVRSLRDRLRMGVIWITHDLAVVAELADRVVVMYSGFIVEQAKVEALYEAPRHPYTVALLKSIPRVDRSSHEPLATIPGFPPDGLAVPPGCPFLPRCPYAVEQCMRENPCLRPVDADHSIACWADLPSGSP